MIIYTDIENIYLNESSIVDILLFSLSENSNYSDFFQKIVDEIIDGEDI